MTFFCIVAADGEWGIGKNGMLPWNLPEDLQRFRSITIGSHSDGRHNAVIMGQRTWLSLPEKYRPMPHRVNIVLSHDASLQAGEGFHVARTLDEALGIAALHAAVVFVIGGAMLYAAAMEDPRCTMIYLTKVPGEHDCDTFISDPHTIGFHMTEDQPGGDGVRYQAWTR